MTDLWNLKRNAVGSHTQQIYQQINPAASAEQVCLLGTMMGNNSHQVVWFLQQETEKCEHCCSGSKTNNREFKC